MATRVWPHRRHHQEIAWDFTTYVLLLPHALCFGLALSQCHQSYRLILESSALLRAALRLTRLASGPAKCDWGWVLHPYPVLQVDSSEILVLVSQHLLLGPQGPVTSAGALTTAERWRILFGLSLWFQKPSVARRGLFSGFFSDYDEKEVAENQQAAIMWQGTEKKKEE